MRRCDSCQCKQWLPAVALAQHTAEPPVDGLAAGLATEAFGWVQRLFDLPADKRLDPTLREALKVMAQEHLARIEAVVKRWAAEEDALANPADKANELRRRMNVRYMNELAAWRADSAGAEYDEAMLNAALRATACRPLLPNDAFYMRTALLLQSMPPREREVALAGERALLARWGTVRAGLAARPVPSQQELESTLIEQLKSSTLPPDAVMPPVVATRLLNRLPHKTYDAAGCAVEQWVLARALAAPSARRAEVFTAYRFETLPLGFDWIATEDADNAPADGSMPRFARAYRIEGSVIAELTLDASGKVTAARIVTRRITVPGRGAMPPLAFDTALDAATIARALKATFPPPDPARLTGGTMIGRQEYQWVVQ